MMCVYMANMATASVLRLTLYPDRIPALQYVPSSPTVKRSRASRYVHVPLPLPPNRPLNYDQSPSKIIRQNILNIPAVFNKFAGNVFKRQKKGIMNVMKKRWPSKDSVYYLNTDLPRPKHPDSALLEPVFRPSSVDLNRSSRLKKQTDIGLTEAGARKRELGDLWASPERAAVGAAGAAGASELSVDTSKRELFSSKEVKTANSAMYTQEKAATRGFLVTPQERTHITRGVIGSEALIDETLKVHRGLESKLLNAKFKPTITSMNEKSTIGPSKEKIAIHDSASLQKSNLLHAKLFPPFPFSFGVDRSKKFNELEETEISIDIMKEAVKSMQPQSKRMAEGQKNILQKISRYLNFALCC